MGRILDWIGYQMLMHGGHWAINPYTRLGRWCLVRAGRHAYR